MPINPKLKAIIEADKEMSPEYKTKLIETMEDATPAFQNNWMAQDDYTRKTNEYKAKMDDFYSKSTAAVESYKTEAQTAKDALDAAKARVAELENAGTIPQVPGANDAFMKEVNGLKTLITGLESKLGNVVTEDKLNSAYQSAVEFIGGTMFEVEEIAARHQEMFGKRYTMADRQALVDFANKQSKEVGHRIKLTDAYDIQMKEEVKKVERAKIEKEVEERYKTNNQVPGGSEGAAGGSPIERGPAQIRLEQEANRKAGITDASKIGYTDWREAAAAGASELVAEGKH
jgi:hypothetical protein